MGTSSYQMIVHAIHVVANEDIPCPLRFLNLASFNLFSDGGFLHVSCMHHTVFSQMDLSTFCSLIIFRLYQFPVWEHHTWSFESAMQLKGYMAESMDSILPISGKMPRRSCLQRSFGLQCLIDPWTKFCQKHRTLFVSQPWCRLQGELFGDGS